MDFSYDCMLLLFVLSLLHTFSFGVRRCDGKVRELRKGISLLRLVKNISIYIDNHAYANRLRQSGRVG